MEVSVLTILHGCMLHGLLLRAAQHYDVCTRHETCACWTWKQWELPNRAVELCKLPIIGMGNGCECSSCMTTRHHDTMTHVIMQIVTNLCINVKFHGTCVLVCMVEWCMQ